MANEKKTQPVRSAPPVQRTSPTPFPGGGQLASNLAANWHPIDWAKQAVSSAWETVKHPIDTLQGMKKGLDLASSFKAAAWHERSGKWPTGYTPQEQRQALEVYRNVAPYFTWVDPKTKERNIDYNALLTIASKSPQDILATVATMGRSALGSLGLRAAEIADIARARNLIRTEDIASKISAAANVGSKIAGAAAFAANPVPAITSKTTQLVAPPLVRFAKGGTKVFDKDGNFTPQVQQAFADQGIDTSIFNTPESRAAVENVLKRGGLSPAKIREARGAAAGVPVTRSMAMREAPPTRVAGDTQAVRTAGEQHIAGQMEDAFGNAPDAGDLGSAFARSYTQAKNAVADAYSRAFRQSGVFANASDFASGAMQSVEQELQKLGLTLNDVMRQSRFPQSQRVLGGFRREGTTFGSLEDQLNDYAGLSTNAPVSIKDLSGVPHTRGPSGEWLDPAGKPITAPAKITYLDMVEQQMPAAPSTGGVNRLTPQNIDSVRRNNLDLSREARSNEDSNVIYAINRGLDNYVESNAHNFSGDGVALSENLRNARAANQQFLQNYGQSSNKGIRDAAKIVENNSTVVDPAGRIEFTGNPADINAHFNGRIINPKTLATPANYTGANTVTGDRMFNDLHNLLDPEGQQALTNTVRQTIATSPATPTEITSAANRYNFIFTPEESDLLGRLQSGRGVITDPALGPSTLSENRFAPTVRRVLSSGVGSFLGSHIPVVGPILGSMFATGIDDAYELSKMKNIGSREFSGAPNVMPNIPAFSAPLQIGGAGANIYQNGINNALPPQSQPQQQAAPTPAPQPTPNTDWVGQQAGQTGQTPSAAPAPDIFGQIWGNPSGQNRQQAAPVAAPKAAAPRPAKPFTEPDEEFAPPPPEEEPQPQYRGGRTAYKTGGKVGGDIEPLVRNLINKAKSAKKVSDKATEPLLNAHDDAIATALAAAQKAI